MKAASTASGGIMELTRSAGEEPGSHQHRVVRQQEVESDKEEVSVRLLERGSGTMDTYTPEADPMSQEAGDPGGWRPPARDSDAEVRMRRQVIASSIVGNLLEW